MAYESPPSEGRIWARRSDYPNLGYTFR